MTTVLGISAYYHDAAAAVVRDGDIVAAAEEERFSRVKHDPSLPLNAIRYCLHRASTSQVDAVVFYDKPLTTFDRLMNTVFFERHRSWHLFKTAMPTWLTHKLWIPLQVERALKELGVRRPPRLTFAEHHQSHAASAFYPSPFDQAAVLTVDGVGEWATTSIGFAEGNRLDLLQQIDFPHSLGLLYSAATSYCGFRVNSGEYKLMGLAPYGQPRFVDRIRDQLIELRTDGSFQLHSERFGFTRGQSMITDEWTTIFDGLAHEPDSVPDQRIADVAASFQAVLEDAVLGLADAAHRHTGSKNLAMAGGVALNCVANGRVSRESNFENLWVQPASSDAGGALGAALLHFFADENNPRQTQTGDAMKGSLLGPEFSDEEIGSYLSGIGAVSTHLTRGDADRYIAQLIAEGNIVAVLRGRMEYGPRALGNRSIIADARNPTMQRDLNIRTKMRESFRPFAPAVLAEHAAEYFDIEQPSPYMLIVSQVADAQLRNQAVESGPADGQRLTKRVAEVRSTIPAVTHVDNSARVQTVDNSRHPDFHGLLAAFHDLTGCPVLINTSFNVRGQPMVCTPEDAYECFMATGIDYLVLGNRVLRRDDQPEAAEHRLDFTTVAPD